VGGTDLVGEHGEAESWLDVAFMAMITRVVAWHHKPIPTYGEDRSLRINMDPTSNFQG